MYLLAMLLSVVTWFQPAEAQPTRKANPNSSDAIERYLWLIETHPAKLKEIHWRVEFHPTTLTIEEDEETPLTTDEVRQEFIKARSWLNDLIKATELDASSIAVAEPPLGTLREPTKPEIAATPLRRLGSVLLADAAFLWAEGDDDAAQRSLKSVLRLSRHIGGGSGPLDVKSMAEHFMFRNAVERCIAMLESDASKARLAADDRDAWCQFLASYSEPHPFPIRDAYIRQIEDDIRWAEARIKDDSVDDELLLEIAKYAAVVPSGDLTERIHEVNPEMNILPANREEVLKVLRAEPRCKPDALRKVQADAKRVLQDVKRLWDRVSTRSELAEVVAELDEAGCLWPVTLTLASTYWREENESSTLIAKLRELCGCTTPEQAP
jgi:hypothetical protein